MSETKNYKIITIDGPAASGKSSVSRELAKKISWAWVSTGSFYRGLAYVAKEKGLDFNDEAALADLANKRDIWHVELSLEKTRVFFKGEEVTENAHSESVGSIASLISQFQKVRDNLLDAQRECAQAHPEGLIAEGRDCGSIVFPKAALKIYLTANQEDRAVRRAMERGENALDIEKEQKQRDARDQGRKVAPLQIPEKAHVLDTSQMNLEQVVKEVESLARGSLSL